MDIKRLQLAGLAALLLVITACATVEPFPIPADNPPLSSVRENIAAHQNQYVAWGGTILATEIKPTFSLVTVLAKPVDSNGEPLQTDQSYGRFIAHFSGFRDPAVFAVGRRLSIAGTIQGSIMRKIGEFDYLHPIVNVENYRLWPMRTTQNYDPYDYGWWWYEPWYFGYPMYPMYYPPAQHGPAPRKTPSP